MSFPTGTLTNGQIATANGIIYTYSTSTTAWTRVNSYLPRNLTTSTAPITAGIGDIWYNTNNDKLYRYTSDGVTNAWLDFTGPAVGNAVNGSNVGASLIPANDGVYDLGSATNRFRTLYVTSSTIDIGGISLSASGGSLAVGGVALATTASVAASVAVGGGPKISSIQLTTGSSYTVTTATAISTSGGYILINGTGFVATPQVTIGTQLATSIGFVSATQLQVQVPAQVNGTYPVYVTNPDGGVAINVPGLTYNQSPVWATGSTLTPGVNGNAISIQLSATDDGSVTYAVSSGSSLPSGLSLSSNGLLSGTVTGLSVETTYNFSIDAIDSYTQKVSQFFSITITIGDAYFPYVSLLLNGNGVNNSTNNTFIDSSSNNFTITRTGTPAQGSLNPFGSVWSNYFNGSSYLSIPANNSFVTGTGDFTIEGWIYVTDLSAIRSICGTRTIADTTTGWNLAVLTNGSMQIYDNIGYAATGAGSVTTNTWCHFAFVRLNNVFYSYINGIQKASSACTRSWTQNTFWVGVNGGDLASGAPFLGYISDIRFINGTALYTATFTPSITPLTAVTNTVLLTCATNRFRDISTVSNAITVTGTPSVERFNPFGNNNVSYSTSTNSGSMYFSDSSNALTDSTTAFNLGTNPFCIEMWFYWTGGASSGYSGLCGSASDYKIALSIWNSKIMYGASSTGNSWNILAAESSVGSNTIIPNQWNHFVLCRTGNTFTGFLNGERDLTTTSSASIISRTEGYTVGAWFSTLYYFSGYISNFRFVVGSNPYDATGLTITVPTSPLTAVTSTSLLLLGTNAGIYDSAMQNNLITVGDAKISTVQSKFGGSSMYFDGTGDYLTHPSSQNFNFGTGNFTMEGWFYQTNLSSSYPAILSNPLAYNQAGAWGLLSSHASSGVRKLQFYCYNADSSNPLLLGTTTLSDNTWYYFALTRSGTTFRLFLNGTIEASATFGGSVTSVSSGLVVGINQTSYPFQGYIDDLRITKGYARYTTTFTPPTSALLGQ
jgi:hypothetical protein